MLMPITEHTYLGFCLQVAWPVIPCSYFPANDKVIHNHVNEISTVEILNIDFESTSISNLLGEFLNSCEDFVNLSIQSKII